MRMNIWFLTKLDKAYNKDTKMYSIKYEGYELTTRDNCESTELSIRLGSYYMPCYNDTPIFPEDVAESSHKVA